MKSLNLHFNFRILGVTEYCGKNYCILYLMRLAVLSLMVWCHGVTVIVKCRGQVARSAWLLCCIWCVRTPNVPVSDLNTLCKPSRKCVHLLNPGILRLIAMKVLYGPRLSYVITKIWAPSSEFIRSLGNGKLFTFVRKHFICMFKMSTGSSIIVRKWNP